MYYIRKRFDDVTKGACSKGGDSLFRLMAIFSIIGVQGVAWSTPFPIHAPSTLTGWPSMAILTPRRFTFCLGRNDPKPLDKMSLVTDGKHRSDRGEPANRCTKSREGGNDVGPDWLFLTTGDHTGEI